MEIQEKKLDSLIEEVFFESDARQLVEELEVLKKNIFKTERTPLEYVEEIVSYKYQNALLNHLHTIKVLSEPLQIQSELEAVIEFLTSIPVVTIQIAFHPSLIQTERLVSQLSQIIGKRVFVNLKSDHRILGGAVIEWNGKYGDYTVKKGLDQYFDELKK